MITRFFIISLYEANNSKLNSNQGFKQIEDNAGKTIVSEGIDANYQDMVNYAVFALIHLKE